MPRQRLVVGSPRSTIETPNPPSVVLHYGGDSGDELLDFPLQEPAGWEKYIAILSLESDPTKFDGIRREFLRSMAPLGPILVPAGLRPGHALEFCVSTRLEGTDKYGRPNRDRRKWFGVVTRIEQPTSEVGELYIEGATNGHAAITRGNAIMGPTMTAEAARIRQQAEGRERVRAALDARLSQELARARILAEAEAREILDQVRRPRNAGRLSRGTDTTRSAPERQENGDTERPTSGNDERPNALQIGRKFTL